MSDLPEVPGGLAIALIARGLLIRNVVDAITPIEVIQAFGGRLSVASALANSSILRTRRS